MSPHSTNRAGARNTALEEAEATLADGIRYERGGVLGRARGCFEELTLQWRETPAIAAEGWWRLANIYRLQSRWEDALRAAAAGAELARTHGLPDQEADALNIEGAVWITRGEMGRARPLFERMLELSQHGSTRAKALQNLGAVAGELGELDEAERLFGESREEYRGAGDARGEANTLLNLGRLQLDRGLAEEARPTLEAAVSASRASGDLEMHAAAQLNLGMVLGALGLMGDAEERITTAYGQFTIADNPVQRVRCLMELAQLAVTKGEEDSARVCLNHAQDVATAADLPRDVAAVKARLSTLPPK